MVVFHYFYLQSNKQLGVGLRLVQSQCAHNVVSTSIRRRFNVMNVVWTLKRSRVFTGIFQYTSIKLNCVLLSTRHQAVVILWYGNVKVTMVTNGRLLVSTFDHVPDVKLWLKECVDYLSWVILLLMIWNWHKVKIFFFLLNLNWLSFGFPNSFTLDILLNSKFYYNLK